MKTLRFALLTMLAMSIVGTASATAAPVWEEETFSLWSEIKVKAKVESTGIVTLTDEGTNVELECEGYHLGTAGPGSAGEVTTVHTSKCIVLKGICASGTATAVNLPWKTKLVFAGTEIRNEIESGGSGEPGWKVECGGVTVDTCTGKTSTSMLNVVEVGKIEADFDAKSPNGACTVGGIGKGKVRGFDIIQLENGKHVRVR